MWEPPCEDNDRQAEVRKQQALSAAIDIPSLFKSAQAYIVELFVCSQLCGRSDKSGQTRPQKPEKIISAKADLNGPLSSLPLFLAEMPHSNPRLSGASHHRATRPSPHEVILKGDGLPVISLQLQSNEQPPAHRKRKRRRRLVERLPATLWRPLRRWGGKSSGYVMGYEGSWPVDDGHERRQKGYVPVRNSGNVAETYQEISRSCRI